MSTASAADPGAAPKKGKKKLLVMLLAAVVTAAAAGGGALYMLKQKTAAEYAEDGDEDAAPAVRRQSKGAPAFVPLDAFTVNLADREAERYAQVGITLELSNPKDGDQIKNFMPAIRNNILMLLAHKTSGELLAREGKTRLALEVRVETARALGFEIDDDALTAEDDTDNTQKKRRRKAVALGPVHAVHFSNFIIQ
jgi:flagellar protein FliL